MSQAGARQTGSAAGNATRVMKEGIVPCTAWKRSGRRFDHKCRGHAALHTRRRALMPRRGGRRLPLDGSGLSPKD